MASLIVEDLYAFQPYFKKLAFSIFIFLFSINIILAMSLLIEKQFYHLENALPHQDQSNWIYSNIKQLLFEWFIQCDTSNKLDSITTQFFSKKYKNIHYMIYLCYESNPSSLKVTFFTLKNNMPICIQSNSHRIKLYAYLLRINSQISIGKFSICPKSGLLKFNSDILMSQYCLYQYKNQKNDHIETNHQVLQKFQCISFILEHYLQNILQLVNYSQAALEKSNIQNYQQLSQQDLRYQTQIKQLTHILPYIHQDLGYLVKSQFKTKQIQFKKYQKSIIKILEIYDKGAVQSASAKIDFITTDKIKEFIWLEKINDQKTQKKQKIQRNLLVLDKLSIRKLKTISHKDYCSIDLLSGVRFSRTNQSRAKLYIEFVRKSSLAQKGEKLISRQKSIIDLYLKEGGKDGIAEYYQVNTFSRPQQDEPNQNQMKIQPLDQNSIFMTPYPYNLTEYMYSRRKFISLNTKILILLKIDKALSHFHSKNFQHLDLKPQNILIDSKQNVKLIDFGQSVHPKIPLSSKPGVSIPYSPPQFFSKFKFQPYRCDSYSFGAIIFELIFQDLPQALPSKKQKILQFYQSANTLKNLYTYQPEKYQYSVQKRISNLFALLCMKCMNINPQHRPSHNWIRVYLKKCLQICSYY